ncbi:LacI family DNA-binding transcriptional regulator [Kitasatospora paracochleata]|uniref:LacI family transcriptional regulator n=1 Tax=Kitasatospora paracochleata TaxID=58354 RepID=A0ABT1IW27_9ACTN|nr:LacI family DNA-binding transcriptional regulator [Kitasatospora paracochleata]MCP2309342.1 LacI family transcriptional regulator [Kitasatospora paracochleata]
MATRPTMKDVAAEAGVGVMTVSRVVNGDPGVAPATAARVEEAVRKLGYHRDDVARQLRRTNQLSQTIGLMVDHVADPFMAAIASAAEDVARQHGSVVLIGSSRDDLRREREVVAAFTARRVDGMVLTPVVGSHRFLRSTIEQGTKVVCVDRAAPGLDVDTVVVDNFDAVRDAVQRLIANGHRRIGYLGDRQEIWTVGERHRGYLAALEAAGIDADPALVRHGLRSGPEAATAVTELLAAPEPPTALLAGNVVVAIGALAVLPPDIAFIGFDDFALAARMTPPVTVIAQDPVAIGTTAAHLLFARIHGDTSPPRTVVMPTTLIPRGSGEIPGPYAQGS